MQKGSHESNKRKIEQNKGVAKSKKAKKPKNMEEKQKVFARATFSPRGVFEVLQKRAETWKRELKANLDEIVFFYVPVTGESCAPGENVLEPVSRVAVSKFPPFQQYVPIFFL